MKVHWSFWLIGAAALLWNGLGSANFLLQMDSEMLSAYRETEQGVIAARPMWVTVVFAIAVFVGVLASLLFLFKKALSLIFYIISFIAVIITVWQAVSTGISFSIGELIGIALLPVLIAAFLIAYTYYAIKKRWLH